MTDAQKETAVIVATVATIFATAIIVGRGAKVLTRKTMSRKFDMKVDETIAARMR